MAEAEEEEVVPALYNHCVAVYQAMHEQASVSPLEPLNDESEEALVYEGFLTRLVTNDVGLAIPYYTKVTNELKRMGCIAQLRRGGSSTPSRWQLLTEPDFEVFKETSSYEKKKSYVLEAERKSRLEIVEDQVAQAVARANSADQTADQFLELAKAIDARLDSIVKLNNLVE